MPRLSVWRTAVVVAAGCSDSGLLTVDPGETPPVDDRVALQGTYCLDAPEEQTFPLKVMFIIDSSGSMQFTDPNGGRQSALGDVLDAFVGSQGVYASLLRFNESTSVIPGGGACPAGSSYGCFTNDLSWLQSQIGNVVSDSLTNYQGALAVAFQVIAEDAERAGPAQRARTRYVVVFLTDGTPDPRCQEGCDAAGENQAYAFCNNDDFQEDTQGILGDPDFEACDDYNQDYQILDRIEDLMALRDATGIGDLRVHTALLCPPDLDPAVIAAFGIDCVASETLLRKMSDAGNGTYRNFSAGESIDYLTFDLQPISIDYALRSLVAVNLSALPVPGGFAPDSDGDGLADADEPVFDCNGDGQIDAALVRDCDLDGHPDGLEARLSADGWDARDPSRPGGCSDPFDEDGDGLSDCTEARLGIERSAADSDGDGLPDGLEALRGTDPAAADADGDLDFDGFTNGDEIRSSMDPRTRDEEERRSDLGVRVSVLPDPDLGAGCFRFEASGLSLVTTLGGALSANPGWNDLRIYAGEGLAGTPADAGRWKASGGRAQFVAPDYKDPADGTLTLPCYSFCELWEDPATCLGRCRE
jgi:hypothetical protein